MEGTLRLGGRRRATTLVVIALVALLASNSSALTVAPWTPAQVASRSTAVVIATVDDIRFDPRDRLLVEVLDLKVHEVWKGQERDSMELARDQYLTRLQEGRRVFKSLGDAAPAFGMIGTLVGLVQMLANMDDPSAIGPAMAIALLTTLYGAVVANLICLPIADKLAAKEGVEEVNQTLIIDGIMAVRDGKSPALIKEMLVAYMPESQQAKLLSEAEAA